MPFDGRLSYRRFEEADVAALTVIMKKAFDEDTRIHLNESEGGPPGYDNGEFLRKWALHVDSAASIAMLDSKAIGLYIVWIFKNNENVLGTIFIDPEYQNQGIGLKIWEDIEARYPDTKLWRTETPGFSKRNHHFYINKCGFSITNIINAGDRFEESYILEKRC